MMPTVPDVFLLLLLNVLLGISVVCLIALVVVAIWREFNERRKESIRSARNSVIRMFISEKGITLGEGGEPPDERALHHRVPKPPENSGVSGH